METISFVTKRSYTYGAICQASQFWQDLVHRCQRRARSCRNCDALISSLDPARISLSRPHWGDDSDMRYGSNDESNTLIVDQNIDSCSTQVLSDHCNKLPRILKFYWLRICTIVLPLTRPLLFYVWRSAWLPSPTLSCTEETHQRSCKYPMMQQTWICNYSTLFVASTWCT